MSCGTHAYLGMYATQFISVCPVGALPHGVCFRCHLKKNRYEPAKECYLKQIEKDGKETWVRAQMRSPGSQ